MKVRGLVIPSLNYPEITEHLQHLAFQHHLFALYIWGEPTLAVPNVIFFVPGYLTLCLSVSASVSYILRLCKGYLTFSICKLLTFSGLKCAVSVYFPQTLLRNAKLARGCQNCRKLCFKHQRCSKVTQVF